MSVVPITVWTSAVVSAVVFAWAGQQPNAPWFCRWPYTVWDWIAHSWRRPASPPRRPDYAKITRLERELGLTDERPIRAHRAVCLTKNCSGVTNELRTWSGVLVARVHHCDVPED